MDAWSGLGNEGWDWPAFSKAVRKSCTVSGEGDGPVLLKVSDVNEPDNAWLKVWTDTFNTLGFPTADPFSGEVCGPMITPESIHPTTGQRWSSANAYLEPARGIANLTVVTGATVSKILFNKSDPANLVAEGVEYTVKQDGEPKAMSVKARKEVVVAAGTMNSPRVLELSGIGSASLLQGLGIDVLVDNPHVGENLQNHVLVGTNFEVKDDSDLPSRDPLMRQEPAAAQAAMAAYGTGYVSTRLAPEPTYLPSQAWCCSTDGDISQAGSLCHQRQQRIRPASLPGCSDRRWTERGAGPPPRHAQR